MNYLVGYTGFVGSNIAKKGDFNFRYNSKNIHEAYGGKPDILIYAGVRAEKYLANTQPDKDFGRIKEAIKNIEKINPKKLILISTVDVYKKPVDVYEDSYIETEKLHSYGKNRLYLEKWVQSNCKDHHIIRLPGLFGENIKKNFVYDIINIIPFMLSSQKYEELNQDNILSDYYTVQPNGFYKCSSITQEKKNSLKNYFQKSGFSAINFTDSRSIFQFYNLSYLWDDIQTLMKNDIRLMNMATEPITAKELYQTLNPESFNNEVQDSPLFYNFKTRFDLYFDGKNGYINSKEDVLFDIKRFVEKSK